MSNEGPDRFSINEKNKKDYDRLKDKDSPFSDNDNWELFMMALIVGYESGTPIALEKKLGYAQAVTFDETDLSIIKAIAVKETGSLDVLINKSKVFSIAEQYANAGIELLVEKVFNGEYGNCVNRINSRLVDFFEKNIKTDLND